MQQFFFELIQIALGNREMLNSIPSAEEWEEAYELARKQGVAGVAFYGISKYIYDAHKKLVSVKGLEVSVDEEEEFDESWLEAVNLPEELYYTWMRQAMDGEQDYNKKWKNANELVALWKENGIDSIVLKGFSFAQFYPDSQVRHCGDLDIFPAYKNTDNTNNSDFTKTEKTPADSFDSMNLYDGSCIPQNINEFSSCENQSPSTSLVVENESIGNKQEINNLGAERSAISGQQMADDNADVWERSNQIVEDKGIKVSRGYYKNSSFRYGKLFVENHRFCSPLRGAKKGKEYEALLQSILMEGPLTKIGDSDMLCPPPLFNALFCISHAYGHFMLEGGIQLRHVLDWAMLMNAYKGLEIWNRLLTECQNFGYYRFAIAMSGLATRIAGIEVPFKYQQDTKAEDLLLEDILKEDKMQVECHNIWQTRWQLIRCAFLSRWKYREFSDESMFASIVRKGIGVIYKGDL